VPDLSLLESLLVGIDPIDTARIFDTVQAVDFHHGRNWTVEAAVRDAAARARDIPLWQLLGGTRPAIAAYASSGERLDIAARVERSLKAQDNGFRALKIRLYHDDWRRDLAVVAAVREAVGDDMDIMADANRGWRMPGDRSRRWNLTTAIACARALAALDVYWLEEPLHTDAVDEYARLRETVDIRIAGGELVRGLGETKRLIEAGAFDVVQNDVVLAGGINGVRQVASWAERAGIEWSPHTWSTGLGLIVNLHAALAFSTAEYLEFPYDPPGWSVERRDFMLPAPLGVGDDGMIAAPEGPGLGIVPDFDALEQWRVG
jgi:L-alanine-DL-glutamate epimerase-like enolase superfamily enzyme